VIIADDPYCHARYDPGLVDLVPQTTEVIRVRNPDPWNGFQQRRTLRYRDQVTSVAPETIQRIQESHQQRLRSVLRRAIRKVEAIVYRPDEAMFWIRPTTQAAVQACNRTGAQVVWATGGPWSALVAARNVSARTGLPYIVDLRDAWTLTHNEFQTRQPEWIRRCDRRLLGRLFGGAQAIVVRYMAELDTYWRAYPGTFDPERIHLIPNGYEGSISSFNVPRGDRCTVLFTGFIGPYWYEVMLDALARLKKMEPETASKLRLLFIGEA